MENAQAARAFLSALTSGVPERLFSYLWTLTPPGVPKKATTIPFAGGTPVDVVVNAALGAMHDRNVYLGMGLSTTRLRASQRLNTRSLKEGEAPRPAAGITALWCDIDFGTAGHNNTRLPTNEGEAEQMLDTILTDCPPSMIVNSGGGWHLYWLLDKPLIVGENDVTLDAITALEERWINMLQDMARKAGYTLDSVQDLERVLRVPGTLNHKPEYGTPRPVTFATCEPDTRYTAAELWARCKAYTVGLVNAGTPQRTRAALAQVSEAFTVDADRGINLAKLDALLAGNMRFRKTWQHNRPDIDNGPDGSASSYEMALINYMVAADWLDQEIVDAVTAWRGKHQFAPAERPAHYFVQSIGKARADRSAGGDGPPPPTEDPPINNGGGGDDDDGGDEREEARAALAALLGLARAGVAIKRIVRVDGRDPYYYIETSRGRIDMGGTKNMSSYAPCCERLFGAGYNVVAPRDQWFRVKDLMIRLTDVESIPEVSAVGLITILIQDYLAKRPFMPNAQEAEEGRDPFMQDGMRCFFLRSFTEWVGINAPHEKLSSAEIAQSLKAAGADTMKVHVLDAKGKRTSRGIWYLPDTTPDDESETLPNVA